MHDVTPEQWARIDALFDVALDCPPEERRDFLEEACDNPDLRAIVLELLAHTEADTAFLDVPVSRRNDALWDDFAEHLFDASDAPASSDQDRIGPYRLIERVGTGGSGVVYRADRADGAFDHTVAIKLLARRANSRTVLERFEHEQQILADLSHPHIAQLHDGGVTETDQPYFVMEYVDGAPIDQYCDKNRLSIDERLSLFATVAEAVHHAHQNLVVHRDLKPSNIFVREDGTPKLLDFGIAKVLDEKAPGLTRTGERWMTPEYAAPEQVKGESVTTATDVYQLGVVLYELITGHRPYRTDARSVYEIERAVCEESPTPPSTVVTQTPDDDTTPEAISRARDTDPSTLRRTLRGDLDAIVMKALRKDPNARYASAEALVEDVRRHLDGRPVHARRGTWTYRTRTFLRRYRGIVAGTVLVVLLALGFAGVTLYQQRQTQQALERAEAEATKATAMKEFMVTLFNEADPIQESGLKATVGDVLDHGASDVTTRLEDHPEAQIELLRSIGNTYANLGHFERAAPLLDSSVAQSRRVYGSRHPETAKSQYVLGWMYQEWEQYDRAAPLYRSVRACNCYDGREDSLLLAAANNNLALVHQNRGQLRRADSLYHRALRIRRQYLDPPHDNLATALNSLGYLAHHRGNWKRAEHYYREALSMRRRLHDSTHFRTAAVLNNLAGLYLDRGRPDEAEPLYREVLPMVRVLFGDTSRYAALTHGALARTLLEQDRPDAAVAPLQTALRLAEETLPSDSPNRAKLRITAGRLHHENGRLDAAESDLRAALRVLDEEVPDHYRTARAHCALGLVLADQGNDEQAQRLLKRAHAHLKDTQGPEAPYTRQAAQALDRLRERQDQTAGDS